MEDKVKLISNIYDFLIEFDFSGISSARFYNTLFLTSDKRRYIINYFKLIGNPNANIIEEKLYSKEFKDILSRIKQIKPGIPPVNKRLILYFGNQGTGKTTKAIQEFPNAKIMNCNSNIEPNDLLEFFDFEDAKKQLIDLGYNVEEELDKSQYDESRKINILNLLMHAGGKPKYTPTPLYNAMINGEPVILDEINLLTYDSLRSLQALLDNKESFTFKDKEIIVKEGFMVIGTMNLEVNGQIESLPSPLVDRAKEIIEFKPNIEQLTEYSLGK